MIGSKRQVKWAEEIQDELLEELEELRGDADPESCPDGYTTSWEEIAEAIQDCDSARDVIDGRGSPLNWAEPDIGDVTLPELEGSEAQIDWATKIRAGMLRDAPEMAPKLATITKASWFIDNRDRRPQLLFTDEELPPLLGSKQAIERAEAIRIYALNVCLENLAEKPGDEHEQEQVDKIRAANDAAGIIRSGGYLIAVPDPVTSVRIPVTRSGHTFTLTAGPYAKRKVFINYDRVIEEGDGWVDYADPGVLSVEGKKVTTDEVLSDDAPRLIPDEWTMGETWQTVHVDASTVSDHNGKSSKILLHRSERFEGLHTYVPRSWVKEAAVEGYVAIDFPSDAKFTVYGGSEKRTLNARQFFHDRTHLTEEPGESQAVEWFELPIHHSRINTVSKGKAVVFDFPPEHQYTRHSVFHPAKLWRDGTLRAHAQWDWRIVAKDEEPITVSTAEMLELMQGWATTPLPKGSTTVDRSGVRHTEPAQLKELERVEVLDDLVDDLD